MFFRTKSSIKTIVKNKIAIIGAGTGGLFAAISLIKKFGDKIDVTVFEKYPHFDLEKGVELSVGPIFQLAMLEMGMDVKKLRELGTPFKKDRRVRNAKFEVMPHIESELVGEHTGYHAKISPENTNYQLYEYSMKRGIFMDFLHQELLLLNNNKDIMNWNCDLKQIVLTENGKKKLIFANGKTSEEFDFVIGADGVHSQVRKLFFDQDLPHHVGANIIYGVIPKEIQKFEGDRFHIVLGDKFTTVAARYLESDKSISTWWSILYPDQDDIEKSNTIFWEKRNDVHCIKKLACHLAEKDNNPVLNEFIELTPIENFKYSGEFLERDPLSLEKWGKNNVALVGDAVHAMMPWAGVGAGMAAEDVLVLVSLLDKYKVFENRESFGQTLKNDLFSKIYEEYKKERIDRITYFYITTHKIAPKGLLSENDFNLRMAGIKTEYGDQRSLTSAVHFNDLLNHQLSSLEKRKEFFEELEQPNLIMENNLDCVNLQKGFR